MEDKYYTPEQLQVLINELQELMEEIIVYEYDYMTEDGKQAVERIADLLNLNILE
jgi:hypothetical protein